MLQIVKSPMQAPTAGETASSSASGGEAAAGDSAAAAGDSAAAAAGDQPIRVRRGVVFDLHSIVL